jgi:hypothetical protein
MATSANSVASVWWDSFDTETFDRCHATGLHGSQSFNKVEPIHFLPPTLTRTWFHQGQVQDSSGT